MRIGIVLPTTDQRAPIFNRVYDAFERTCPDGWEFLIDVPENYPTVGEAWNAAAPDVLDADYVFFTADDAEPHPGWAEVAVRTAEAGYIPAPHLLYPDGTMEATGSMGFGVMLHDAPDNTPCRNVGIPFVRPEWYERVGPFADRHYSVDDLWCWKASLLGIQAVYRSGFRFTHHHYRPGSEGTRARAQLDNRATVEDMARLTLPARIPA